MTTQAIQVTTPTQFGTGDGTTTQFGLAQPEQLPLAVIVNSLFQADWQGNNAVLSTPRTNLLFSSTPTSHWTLGGGLTPVGSIIAPDGSTGGQIYLSNSTFGAYITDTVYLQFGVTYTFSVWARLVLGAPVTGTILNVSDVFSIPVISINNQWQRFTLTFTAGPAGTYQQASLSMLKYLDAGVQIAFFGAQIEVGSAETPLIPCTVNPVTVIDYEVSSVAPRTNLLPHSNTLSDPTWTFASCTVAAAGSTVMTPGGTTDAWLVTVSPGYTNVLITNTGITGSFVKKVVTFSVYVGMDPASSFTLSGIPITFQIADGAGNVYASHDWVAQLGQFDTGGPGFSASPPQSYYCGNLWSRVSITAELDSVAVSGLQLIINPFDAAGITGYTMYLWNAQVEYGNTATPYLATNASAVTEPGDALTIGYGQVEFTVAPPLGAALTWTGLLVYSPQAPVFPLWQETLLSQYANSPILVQLIEDFAEYIDPSANIDAFFNFVWNIDTAVGYGLDVWGRILGVSRVLQVASGTYFGFEGSTGPFNASGDSFGGGPAPTGANPFYTGAATTSNFALLDPAYRILLLAKALANISNGSIQSTNQILINLFLASVPGRTGNAYCTDGLDMTMTYTFAVRPVLTPVEVAIVAQSGVLPKPTGVLATVVQI